MLKECEKLVKQAWDLVEPADPRLKWNHAAADDAVCDDLNRVRAAGGYGKSVIDDLQEMLRYRMFRCPVTAWKSIEKMYVSMLVLLSHHDVMEIFTADWDAARRIMAEARPLYQKLSGKDPFPDVFDEDKDGNEAM